MNDANRTFKLPNEVREVLTRIVLNESDNLADYKFSDWAFLAKFAVAHQSHRTGLMPAEITKRPAWKHPKIRAILATAKTPEVKPPVKMAEKPIKPEGKTKKLTKVEDTPKKIDLPTTGRRFAMGRGVDLTKSFTPGKVQLTPPGASKQELP